jgi:type I restriction-modification system DNA methylase subunit
MNITEQHKQILSQMTIDENTTTLTGTLDRKMYVEINEVIETLGGHWSRKDKCHIWDCNPGDKLNEILNPQTKTVTTTLETANERKKTFQAFYTPDHIADTLVRHCEDKYPYAVPATILEPSAGDGQLLKAIRRKWTNATIDCCELDPGARSKLSEIAGVNLVGDDFLQYQTDTRYELIIANPPFNKHQDILHIQKMYDLLSDNGIIVTVCGYHSFDASHKVDVAFRDWLSTLDYAEYEIDPGEFKSSGTMVSSKLLVIDK